MALSTLPPEEVLATTLGTEFAPGTNIRGAVAGATWRYLLPSMERSRVLCVGRPPAADIAALAACAREVTVLEERGGDRSVVAAGAVPGETPAVVRSVTGAHAASWLGDRPDATIDLVWLPPADRASAGSGGRPAVLTTELPRLLASDGVVVDERPDPVASQASVPGAATRVRRVVDVRPARGSLRSAVSVDDGGAAGMLAQRGLLGGGHELPGPRPVRAVLRPLLGPLLRRRGGTTRRITLTVGPGSSGTTLPQPPAYLIALARREGLDVSTWRCAIAAPGIYNTQKVLALLAPADAPDPAIVVKMTRDPSVNARLENERDALRRLEELGFAADDRVPRVLFAGRHAGLAIVGEHAVPGEQFGARAGSEPGGGPIVDAADWLRTLAVGSARPAAAGDVARALAELHRRYVALCRPSPAQADRLAREIERVDAADGPIPLVFQHGDPGTWNLMVGDDGTVRFLDWENAEPAGPPLWDLFYLLRSHAVGAARRAGVRRRLTAVERWMFGASPVSPLVVGAVQRYTDEVGLDRRLIEPLFHLCWMHQALKEATRMAPDRVGGGHYNQLLRLGLERRDAPTLHQLFGARA